MFATITIAALLAAAPVNAVMQWSMTTTSNGTAVNFGTKYVADTPSGNHEDEDSRDYAMSDLESTFRGLTRAQLRGQGNVAFTFLRQAGTLVCTGRAHGGAAGGDFTFTLDPGFVRELQRRGVGTVSEQQQMEWLFSGIDVYGMLDAFKSQGFATPNAEQLTRAFEHGVTAQYVNALAAAGVHPRMVEDVIRASDHGVTARYLAELASYGFHGLNVDQVVNLSDHGVSANYLTGLSQLGYHVTTDQAIDLVDHGVSIRYITQLRRAGYTNLSVSDLVRLADHGVH